MDKFYGNQGLGKHGGGLDEIKSDLSKADLNRLKDYLGLGKHGGGLDEIKSDLSKADLNRLKDYLGLGKHGGGLDEIKSDLSKADLNRLKDYLGLGKHGGGLDEIKSDLSKADLNRLKDYLGLGKGGARVIAKEKEKEKEEPKKPKEKEKEKEEPKKSLAHLFKTVNDKEEPKEAEAKAEEPKEKGYWGRFRESLGFGNKLAVMPDHQMMYSPLNPAKPVPEMKAKGKGKGRKLIPKAQLHSSTISGFGKGGAVLGGAVLRAMKGGKMPDESPTKGGRQARAEMVKKIMKEKGMKMIEASSYIKKNGIKY
jgi:hypothetical protein